MEEKEYKHLLRPCEIPEGGSLGLTFEVDLPMELRRGDVFEHSLRKEEPWDKEWDWLNGTFWRVDGVIYRKKGKGYIKEISISPPLSKRRKWYNFF